MSLLVILEMEMSISNAAPKDSLKEISVVNYFSAHLRRNLRSCSKRRFESGIKIGGGDRGIPLEPFSLVGGRIYRRSLACQSFRLADLA